MGSTCCQAQNAAMCPREPCKGRMTVRRHGHVPNDDLPPMPIPDPILSVGQLPARDVWLSELRY